MKKLFLLSVALIIGATLYAQVKIGQTVPDIKFDTILNTHEKKVETVAGLKGKIIWLEFWATWCSPCVEAMPHLQELQKQFEGRLQVITISTEKEKRVKQFITNRPSNLWFAVDTADKFSELFPYRTIPHAVLIDQAGKVIAITEPGNITHDIIADVLAGKPVNLPLKADDQTDDPIKTYFNANASVERRFLVQPAIRGLGSSSHTYLRDSVFKNRRITMINFPLESIYRIAYKNLPSGRVIDLTPKENISQNKMMYCIDVIVPKGQENVLLPTLKRELASRFELKASIEKRLKQVYVLKIADTAKIEQLKQSTTVEETFGASHGSFSGKGIKLSKIADYLEGFGLVKLPVVDETGSNKKYDISFEVQPEKNGSLTEALNGLGLKLEPGEREIDMLVFR